MKRIFKDIKTNLITGFLGVGKTSAILNLMKQKPAHENWSVLVNEFGSIGIDGAIYAAQGIQVKEIPGGCMCCSAGVPLHMAVNQILKTTNPDRLLIEPSGLGHPKRVLDTLRGKYLKEILDLRATICLVDARNIYDERYTSHENFIDQISLADIIVANKSDLSDANTLKDFRGYIQTQFPNKKRIIESQYGCFDIALLEENAATCPQALHPNHHETRLSSTRKDDGYVSLGVTFSPENAFSSEKLIALFQKVHAERIKGILQTESGWKLYNCYQSDNQIQNINYCTENRLEIIIKKPTNFNERDLKEAITHCLLQSTSQVI